MMATGVIRNLAEFTLPSTFQLPLLHSSLHHDMDFQDTSEEEEDDDLLEEEEMEELVDDSPPGPVSVRSMDVHNPSHEDKDAEMPLQLLKFSELISSDIQRYFGQKTKEEDPDSCNIYEDHYVPRPSGQEMYYQDLVRMAQRHDDKEDSFDPLRPPAEFDQKALRTISSKEDPKKLGPLTELFDFGLRKYARQKASANKDGRQQRLSKKYAHIVPMHRRMLPTSFWKEPCPSPTCILNTNTPDFSDLLENWTSDTSHELQNASRELMGEFGRYNPPA